MFHNEPVEVFVGVSVWTAPFSSAIAVEKETQIP